MILGSCSVTPRLLLSQFLGVDPGSTPGILQCCRWKPRLSSLFHIEYQSLCSISLGYRLHFEFNFNFFLDFLFKCLTGITFNSVQETSSARDQAQTLRHGRDVFYHVDHNSSLKNMLKFSPITHFLHTLLSFI